MKYRDHINLAFLLFNIVLYTAMVSHFFTLYLMSSGMFFGFLTGAVCPDFTVDCSDMWSRMNSRMHNFAYAVGFTLAAFLSLNIFLKYMTVSVQSKTPSNTLIIYEAFLFLVFLGFGWTAHLIGDMIQGGVKCSGFKRNIGITKWDWDSYYGERGCFDFSMPGNLISFLLFIFCIVIISKNMAFYSLSYSPLVLWGLFLVSGSYKNVMFKLYIIGATFGLLYLILLWFIS